MAKRQKPPRPAPTPRALEERIADILLPDEPPDLWDAMEDPRVIRLLDKLELDAGDGKPLPDEVAMFERLQGALPEHLQRELTRYDDLKVDQEIRARHAAYLVGVAVGRRLAGAR